MTMEPEYEQQEERDQDDQFCHHDQQFETPTDLREVEDIIAVMRTKEGTVYGCCDYLALRNGAERDMVDESWRQRMCEWMYGVVDHCNFRRDIVAVSTAYLDLCLSRYPELVESRRCFQLAAMTSLYLAMKVYDTTFIKLESLVKLGRGLFQEEDVIRMEDRILRRLNWRVHPPTTMCFVRQYLRIFPQTIAASTTYMVSEISRFITEISVCLYKFIRYQPSMIAYAAILIAMDGIADQSLPNWQRHQVYCRMDNIAKLSHTSVEMQRVMIVLKSSFEKNVNIKELMKTIDPNAKPGRGSKSRRLQQDHNGSPKDVAQTVEC